MRDDGLADLLVRERRGAHDLPAEDMHRLGYPPLAGNEVADAFGFLTHYTAYDLLPDIEHAQMMTAGRQGSRWGSILHTAVEEAGKYADVDGVELTSGFDGGAYVWSWCRMRGEDRLEEAVLRAYPDAGGDGVQTELLALARRVHYPFFMWSAITWASHLGSEAFEDDGRRQIRRFAEELSSKLTESFDKTAARVDRLEQLREAGEKRNQEALDKVGHLIVENPNEGRWGSLA